jgi:hypothetical protein
LLRLRAILLSSVLVLPVLTGCRPPVVRSVETAAHNPVRPAVTAPPAKRPKAVSTPSPCPKACRVWIQHLVVAEYLAAVWRSTHGPTRWGAPAPVSSGTCPAGPVHDLIDITFTIAAPWFQSIAWRESNCQPGARNASGSSGIGQLLGHDDLLRAACPLLDPSVSWADFHCNVEASWRLFVGLGVAPWRL